MIIGKKAVKKILDSMNLTHAQVAEIVGTDRVNFTVRVGRGYYDKPGNLAKLLYQLGGSLELKIECIATLPNGEKIEMPIDRNFLALDEE